MPSPKNHRRDAGSDKLTAEFTSGQLVIGICVTFFLAAFCVMVGILIGKYDPSLQHPQDAGRTAKTAARVQEKDRAVRAPSASEGIQTTPRTNMLKPEDEMPAKTPTAREGSGPEHQERPGRRVFLPPLPTVRNSTPVPDAPVRLSPSDGAESTVSRVQIAPLSEALAERVLSEAAPAPSDPGPQAAPAIASERADSAEEGVGGPEAVLPQEPQAETAAVLPETPPARGNFGIQAASFSGHERERKAADFKRRLKENAGLDSEILNSEDGQYCRVVIIGYETRASASAACAELKQKAGFADAFVRALP